MDFNFQTNVFKGLGLCLHAEDYKGSELTIEVTTTENESTSYTASSDLGLFNLGILYPESTMTVKDSYGVKLVSITFVDSRPN